MYFFLGFLLHNIIFCSFFKDKCHIHMWGYSRAKNTKLRNKFKNNFVDKWAFWWIMTIRTKKGTIFYWIIKNLLTISESGCIISRHQTEIVVVHIQFFFYRVGTDSRSKRIVVIDTALCVATAILEVIVRSCRWRTMKKKMGKFKFLFAFDVCVNAWRNFFSVVSCVYYVTFHCFI